MPDFDDDLFADDEVEESPIEVESINPIERLIYWAPAFLFAVSVMYLLITIVGDPWQQRERAKPALSYYLDALDSLHSVRTPTAAMTPGDKRRQLLISLVNLHRLLFHYDGYLDHPDELLKNPTTYINPYLLLAETNRLLAEVSVESREAAFWVGARENYTRALHFENVKRSPSLQKQWDKQFVRALQAGDPKAEILRRRGRRQRYIRYYRALANLQSGNIQTALNEWKDLRVFFFREEMGRLRRQREGKENRWHVEPFPWVDFELRKEEKVKLHFYLGDAYGRIGEEKKAEQEYRLFLLEAPRSREAFLAHMRLGRMQYVQGRDVMATTRTLVGDVRRQRLHRAQQHFENARQAFNKVVSASPQEDLLRDAYFWGGVAMLSYCQTIDVGQETWWDLSRAAGLQLQALLERYSGAALPKQALAFPGRLGRILLEDAKAGIGPLGGVVDFAIGGTLVLGAQERSTPRSVRNRLLRQSRDFFDASTSNIGSGHAEGEARVMIGRTLIVEDRLTDARRIFQHALSTFQDSMIVAAARYGLGKTFLLEGELEAAWNQLRRLPAGQALPSEQLLSADDVADTLRRLGQAYIAQADLAGGGRQWSGLAPGSPGWVAALQMADQQKRALENAQDVYATLRKKYRPQDSETALQIAMLFARRARLLEQPPFGSRGDLAEARTFLLSAADLYWRTAADAPGSSFSAEALEEAGNLFFSLGAYERAITCYQLFEVRHDRSQRLSKVRNAMGLAYQRLGIYDKSELVFRLNAEDTKTAEGRKSLYHLGETYFFWGAPHWGGPQPPAELASKEKESTSTPENQAVAYSSLLTTEDIMDWHGLIQGLQMARGSTMHSPQRRIADLLGESFFMRLRDLEPGSRVTEATQTFLVESLNQLLKKSSFYERSAWQDVELVDEVASLLRWGRENLRPDQLLRSNRLLLESAFPVQVARSLGGKEQSTIPHSAAEVFMYVRRLPGHGPESIPWRNSTFALGETLYAIARRLRLQGEREPTNTADPAAEGAGEEASEKAVERRAWQQETATLYFHKASEVLEEALARYVLAPFHPKGLSREREPEQYVDVMRQRFKASYLLAQTYRSLGRTPKALALFRSLIDGDRYPEEDILENEGRRDAVLIRYHRNAYFYLGVLLHEAGRYPEAYQVYEMANDRLKTSESPYLLYRMGEALRAQGRLAEARNRYMQAHHLAKNAPAAEEGTFDEFGVPFWQKINAQRLKDLQYLERTREAANR